MIASPLKFNSLFLFGETFPFGGPSDAPMNRNSDFILSCNLSLVGLTAKSSFLYAGKGETVEKWQAVEKEKEEEKGIFLVL